MPFTLSPGRRVSLAEVEATVTGRVPVELDQATRDRVRSSREILEKFVADGRVIYGVNTSMGGFVDYLGTSRASQPPPTPLAPFATTTAPGRPEPRN